MVKYTGIYLQVPLHFMSEFIYLVI